MTAIMSLPFTARLVDSASTFMLGSRLKMSCRHAEGDHDSAPGNHGVRVRERGRGADKRRK
jgi:hypothetical protein